MVRCGMTHSLKSIEVSRSLLSHPKRLIDLHLLDLIFALIDLQHSLRTLLMWSRGCNKTTLKMRGLLPQN
jgi:hypothetical protein